MRKPIYYTFISVLYILAIVCFFAAMGTMVSKKYEVDESYWKIDGNRTLTSEQRKQQLEKLDKEGRQMEYKAYTFTVIAVVTALTATGVLISRHKIVRTQKSST